MDAQEIVIVDIVYRAYYHAYQKNEMRGIVDIANENGLSLEDVKRSILFLEGENQIKFDNKGYDPVKSGAVYKLTKSGYSWFAKTCYENELLNRTKPPVTTRKNQMKIFISHASSNKKYGSALVELLLGIGIKDEQIVFTSNPAYGIPIGNNIFNWLKTQISEESFVVYLLSPDYYKSIACLNEMGASWIVENEHAAIFLPGFDLSDKSFQSGAIDPREIGFFINDEDRLTQFCQMLEKYFSITTNYVILAQRIKKFLSEIDALAGELEPVKAEKAPSSERTKSEVTEIERSLREGVELKRKIDDIPIISGTYGLSKQSEKFLKDILADKASDAELLMLNYIISRAKFKLGVGWQMQHEISTINDWEDVVELNHMLSRDYETVIRKFDIRGLTEVSAVTSYDNPKEVSLKNDLAKYMLNLPQDLVDKIEDSVNRNRKSGNSVVEELDDLPF
ncbi:MULTISPECIES: toll/interleukin-1 receptor domain-containing protein [Pedobacter]|uniref:TIR domain-containing protein n=1 Tax=Pedobacter suwonensis TaxID=332999 RepID=A0A1I0TTK9_9SPHI|nr:MULTISPECIES: toll/interleukin-1 receptor domain-containing protein [Pedobacter]SFA55119.1 TIR domain-containing protein [Pedobacter suwonensis]